MNQSKNWNNIPCTIYNKETQNYITVSKRHDIIVRSNINKYGIVEQSESCDQCKMGYYKQINVKDN